MVAPILEIKSFLSYKPGEVSSALLSNGRQIRFRYQVLNNSNQPKRFLAGVQPGGRISYNFLADVKRTGELTLHETTNIPDGWMGYADVNFSLDRLKIYAQIKYKDEWISFPLGVFLMDSGVREGASGSRKRSMRLFDLSKILRDDKATDRYVVPAGTNIITAVAQVLNSAKISDQSLTPVATTMTSDRSWDPGTLKIQIINELLDMINYGSIFFDENGVAVARPYSLPALRTPEISYKTDSDSVLASEMTESFETFEVANTWVATVSQPDRDVLTATYVNDSPNSPTSTVSRGRTIVDFRMETEVHSQSDLNNLVQRIAHEASQVYTHIDFATAIMPVHGENWTIEIEHGSMGIKDIFSETQWDIPLVAGGLMTHSARKLINIDK